MSLASAAQGAVSSLDTFIAGLRGLSVASDKLLRVLNGPALEIRTDARDDMFRLALNDPRLSILKTAAAQVQRPDPRANMFRATPAELAIGIANPLDPRLSAMRRITTITWVKVLSQKAPGKSRLFDQDVPTPPRSNLVKQGGFFS